MVFIQELESKPILLVEPFNPNLVASIQETKLEDALSLSKEFGMAGYPGCIDSMDATYRQALPSSTNLILDVSYVVQSSLQMGGSVPHSAGVLFKRIRRYVLYDTVLQSHWRRSARMKVHNMEIRK